MRTLLVVCLLFLAFYGAWGAFRSDEVWSVQAAVQPPAAMMHELRADIHPPLYYELLAGWIRLFGTSEFAVRSLSGLFFLLSTLALYRGALRYFGGTTALFATVAYAASPLALLAAQFARMYSLVSLLSILSTWAFLDLAVRPRKRSIFVYALVNALGTFAHIWFFFLLLAQGVCALVWYRERLVKFAAAAALSLAPYAALWLPVLLSQMGKSSEATAWIRPPSLGEIGATLLMHLGLLLVILPVPLLASTAKDEPAWPVALPRLLLPVMLGLTVAVPLLLSFIKPVFYSRFTIVGLHLTALIAGTILARTPRPLLAILLLGFSFVGVAFAGRPAPGDAKNTAEYLRNHLQEGDVVVFTSLTRLPVMYYLDQPLSRRKILTTSFPSEIDVHPGYEGNITDPGRAARYAAEAEALVRQVRTEHAGRRVYFLHGFRPEVDEILRRRLQAELEMLPGAGYHHEKRAQYYTDMEVYAVSR